MLNVYNYSHTGTVYKLMCIHVHTCTCTCITMSTHAYHALRQCTQVGWGQASDACTCTHMYVHVHTCVCVHIYEVWGRAKPVTHTYIIRIVPHSEPHANALDNYNRNELFD